MTFKLRLRAFSTLELLAVMAVIGTLIAMALGGLAILQQNNRDTDRKVLIGQIASAVDDFFRTNGRYPLAPPAGEFSWQTTSVTVGSRVIPLPSYKNYNATSTTSARTLYRYIKDNVGYKICVSLEAGVWHSVGNSSAVC